MYKSVDIIGNVLGKNSETSFFEGGGYLGPLQSRGMVSIGWLLGGVRSFDFFEDFINKWPLMRWLGTTLSFFYGIFVDYLCESINAIFKSSMFPNSLRLADVTFLHKKDSKELKEDYRSVIVLPILSKIFESKMCAQISAFFENVFSKLMRISKGYSTQHSDLKMLEKWKKCVSKGKVFGALLLDLSVNRCIWFSQPQITYSQMECLQLDYLSVRKQRIKIENIYSTWKLYLELHKVQNWERYYSILMADLFFIISN